MNLPGKLPKLLKQAESFKDLPDGWHFTEGVPATDYVVDTVRSVAFTLAKDDKFDLTRIEVFPAIDGGVMIRCDYGEDEEYEIQCNPNNTVDIVIMKAGNGDLLDEQEELSIEDALSFLSIDK